MTGSVLVVTASAALSKAMGHVLGRRGLSVLALESADEAARALSQFECAVFSDELPDAFAAAGWMLANGRTDAVVFYGSHMDHEQRLRSANLGGHVHTSEGLHRLSLVVVDAIAETRLARASGADGESFRPELRTGPRRRR
jgi:hypothetical protein